MSFGFLYVLVLLPKKDIPVVTLRISSIAVTASRLGVKENLPSVLAAIVVSANVAFLEMVSWFIIGTLPMFRLNINVDFSASLTASLNMRRSPSSLVSFTTWCAVEMSTMVGAILPVAGTCILRLGGGLDDAGVGLVLT